MPRRRRRSRRSSPPMSARRCRRAAAVAMAARAVVRHQARRRHRGRRGRPRHRKASRVATAQGLLWAKARVVVLHRIVARVRRNRVMLNRASPQTLARRPAPTHRRRRPRPASDPASSRRCRAPSTHCAARDGSAASVDPSRLGGAGRRDLARRCDRTIVEVTGGAPARPDLEQGRHDLAAHRHHLRAARMEVAAARRMQR